MIFNDKINLLFKAKSVKNYNTLKIALCTMALAFVINSCSKKDDEAEMPIIKETKMTQVTIKTSLGDIQLELDAEKAPITVENFVSIAKSGYYTDTIFHRVINGFMVQGGGLTADMGNKSSGTAPIQNEANNGLSNDRGTIAMARTMEPHSATSQFFINHKDNGFLNHTGENPQGWGYAVFGKVTEGMDVVDAIADVATGSSGGHQDVPLEVINIESVTVSE
jgi:peptidyl-prolyl cis-trans isomerase B (cyclophilin B)